MTLYGIRFASKVLHTSAFFWVMNISLICKLLKSEMQGVIFASIGQSQFYIMVDLSYPNSLDSQCEQSDLIHADNLFTQASSNKDKYNDRVLPMMLM